MPNAPISAGFLIACTCSSLPHDHVGSFAQFEMSNASSSRLVERCRELVLPGTIGNLMTSIVADPMLSLETPTSRLVNDGDLPFACEIEHWW